jgi:hypothetical protein
VAGKNPREAADNFIGFLKETLSCISSHYVKAFQESNRLYKFYYDPYAKVCDGDGGEYCLSITQIFRVVPHSELNGQFKAKTQEYSYRLLGGPEEQNEIIAYHWHPLEPGVHWPHLHLKALPKVHLPTSRVCLEDVVSMLIRDYHIKPHRSHAECNEILQRNKKAFEKMATWKIQHP